MTKSSIWQESSGVAECSRRQADEAAMSFWMPRTFGARGPNFRESAGSEV